MSLGIFCRLFNLFESACRALDSKIESRAEENYAEQREAVEKAEELEERAALFLQHLAWSCLSDTEECQESVREMQNEAALLQLKANKIVWHSSPKIPPAFYRINAFRSKMLDQSRHQKKGLKFASKLLTLPCLNARLTDKFILAERS